MSWTIPHWFRPLVSKTKRRNVAPRLESLEDRTAPADMGIGSLDVKAPVVSLKLLRDTVGPGGSNRDRITADPTVVGKAADDVRSVRLFAGFDDARTSQFVNVTDRMKSRDGRFGLDRTTIVRINGGPLNNGNHTLKIFAIDAAGNRSKVANLRFTYDRHVVRPLLDLTPATDTAPPGDRMTTAAIVSITGVTDPGARVTMNGRTTAADATGRFTFANVDLALGPNLFNVAAVDRAGNRITSRRIITRTAESLQEQTVVSQISPANGSEMVSLTRETIVSFSKTIDPTTVTNDSLYLIAKGAKIPGSIRVSPTNSFAMFFYDAPLPESTEVRVVVDGNKIKDSSGDFIDGDRDGEPGGMATADFRTLPLTFIPNTRVFGYVYDSYNKNPDGSDIPVVGATISLDARPDVKAITDANGFFELGLQDFDGDTISDGLPAPEFFVHIDGSTAINAPAGSSYARLGKPFHSVPGQRVQLRMDGSPVDVDPTTPGDQFHVYLPPMAMQDIVTLPNDQDASVGFGPSVTDPDRLAELFPNLTPEQRSLMSLMQVVYPAGSAKSENGTPATLAMIIPVNPDRLPAPLPGGVDPKLVISIQAGTVDGQGNPQFNVSGGSTNFDVPAPVTFPNLEGLAPGEKSLIWSFDHDAGKWVVIGTGTVSPDGKSIVSDPGVGILAPGWHFSNPGSQGEGEGEGDDDDDGDDDFNPCESETYRRLLTSNYSPEVAEALARAGADLQSIDDGTGSYKYDNYHIDVDQMPPGVTPQQFLKNLMRDINGTVNNPYFDTFNEFIPNFSGRDARIGDIYDIDIPLDNGSVMITDISDSHFDVTTINSPVTGSHPESGSRSFGFEINPDGSTRFYTRGASRGTVPLDPGVGDALQHLDWIAMMKGLKDTIDRLGGRARPNSFDEDRHRVDGPSPCVASLLAGTHQDHTHASLSTPQANTRTIRTKFAYRLDYYLTGSAGSNPFTQFGTTNRNGELQAVLPPDTLYSLHLYDTSHDLYGQVAGFSSQSGVLTDFGTVVLDKTLLVDDQDEDGLPDLGEYTLGTNPTAIDSDGDGITDDAEIAQGLNPVDDIAFPTGVISSLPMPGSAEAVAVAGDLAYVATGSHGLAIVDGARFDNPVLLGQIDLPGAASDVDVDLTRNLAAVATGTSLEVVDVSDPMMPRVTQSIALNSARVEVVNGLAYAAADNFIRAIDLSTGTVVQTLFLGASGQVTGMAREGSNLYAYISGSDVLFVIDVSREGQAAIRGQLAVSIASTDVGVFAGNGVVWLAGSGLRTIDVSNPASPVLISDADTFFTARRVALNGSGLALVTPDGANSLDLYTSADTQDTDNFLTRFTLSAPARDVAVSRGIGYVAAGSRLDVVNYRPFDTQGVAPTVAVTVDAFDADAGTPGVQVIEGGATSIRAAVTDDVQVRSVEFLVNGQVVATDVAFPFDYVAAVPAVAAGGTTLNVQARATDTGGNVALSNVATFTVVPDTFPPTIESIDPADGSTRFEGQRFVRVRFSEPIAAAGVTNANFRLVSAGPNGVFGDADDSVVPAELALRDSDRLVQLTVAAPGLSSGEYRLEIAQTAIADRAGNVLGAVTRTDAFTVVEFDESTEFLPFGTDVSLRQDDSSFEISPMPFAFEFFGQPVTGPVYVTTNGVIEFGQNSVGGTYSNSSLPYGDRQVVMPFWDDIDPRFTGTIGLYDADGVRAITFLDVPYYSNTPQKVSFQVAFFANGQIQMRYARMDPLQSGSATLGLSDGVRVATPSLGNIENDPTLAITSATGILDQAGLNALTANPQNDLLVFTPDGTGGYTIVRNPLRDSTVARWNAEVLDAIRATGTPPPKAARALAIVHGAIFDAVNSVSDRYTTLLLDGTSSTTASTRAAAIAAARDVLVGLFPTRTAQFDALQTQQLAAIADSADKAAGIALGRAVAAAWLADRANDGSAATVAYTPGTDPGDWQPTPPANAPALLPQWPNVRPFAMTSGNQFRPAAPPALDSAEYAAAVAEVEAVGRVDSTTRTADQTAIAQFWADGGGTFTPPGHWNQIAAEASRYRSQDLLESARTFALLNVALADAAISSWDAKYAYDLWRPITAIRGADTDGNPVTTADPTWAPLLTTPPFPTYTSGHSTFSGAASQVLSRLFGDNVPFTTNGDPTVVGIAPRQFTSFTTAANEAGMSRIYGGIHYSFDNTAGLAAGRSLGDYVVDTLIVTR